MVVNTLGHRECILHFLQELYLCFEKEGRALFDQSECSQGSTRAAVRLWQAQSLIHLLICFGKISIDLYDTQPQSPVPSVDGSIFV